MGNRVRAGVVTVGVLAVALVVVGVVLWDGGPTREFGWFAFAPQADQPHTNGLEEVVPQVPVSALLSTRMELGVGLACAGLVLLGGLVGFWLGRRGRRSAVTGPAGTPA